VPSGKSPAGRAWRAAWSPLTRRYIKIRDSEQLSGSCNSASRTFQDRDAGGWRSSWLTLAPNHPENLLLGFQFHRYRIPMPELQYHVIDSHGVRVGISDWYWEQQRHLGEFDGKIKYQRLLRPGETASDCVIREKKREDTMRADLRGMSRFIWSEVMPQRARRTMADLAQALDQSYRLYVRGRTIIAS